MRSRSGFSPCVISSIASPEAESWMRSFPQNVMCRLYWSSNPRDIIATLIDIVTNITPTTPILTQCIPETEHTPFGQYNALSAPSPFPRQDDSKVAIALISIELHIISRSLDLYLLGPGNYPANCCDLKVPNVL